jgi:tRNA-specific 2-thiouridylase
MKLWGGPSDSGCCSVADVDDARRVAQQLGIPHHVFNFSDDFDARVVDPYVAAHASGRTPNPCIECNRHIKFDRLFARAWALGFDAVATGHYAQVAETTEGSFSLLRGVDPAKDQSYVLYMLGQDQLKRLLLPIGSLSKAEVRGMAQSMGLRTAIKPDSQDVCFISRVGGRQAFLGARIPLRPAKVYEAGSVVAEVPAAELVTVGQRRGFGTAGRRRYVVSVDADEGRIELGTLDDLLDTEILVRDLTWVDRPPPGDENLMVQTSAHGHPVPGRWIPDRGAVAVEAPVRRVAPGQSVVLYRGAAVLGGGIAA